MKSGIYFNAKTLVMFEINILTSTIAEVAKFDEQFGDVIVGVFKIEDLLTSGVNIEYLGKI